MGRVLCHVFPLLKFACSLELGSRFELRKAFHMLNQ